MNYIELKDIEKILQLGKKSIKFLRSKNPERAYNGKELTKSQLIYQIIFLMDAPEESQMICEHCGEPVKSNKADSWIICPECGFFKPN